MMKAIPIFLGIILLVGMVPLGVTAATSSGTVVILASDNPADQATAHDLALMIPGAVVVTTGWGTYDETVLNEIESYDPSMVIIIGGDAAVPDAYYQALSDLGYNVQRIAGDNQYDTQQLAFEWAFENGYNYSGDVMIVNGRNYAEVQAMTQDGYFVIMVNEKYNEQLKLMTKMEVKNVMASQDAEKIVREKTGMSPQVQNEEQIAEQLMQQVYQMYQNATDPDQKEQYYEMYTRMQQFINQGQYEKAMLVANGDMSMKMAHKSAMEKNHEEMKYEMMVNVANKLIEKLQEKGVDTTQYSDELSAAEQDYQNGDVQKALQELEQLIHELKQAIKDHGGMSDTSTHTCTNTMSSTSTMTSSTSWTSTTSATTSTTNITTTTTTEGGVKG